MGYCQDLLVFLLLFNCVFLLASGDDQCHVTPKCSCQFDKDNVPVEEQSSGTEALAGAVGALSSLLVTGGGFGIWYLVKSKMGSPGGDFSRSNSVVSDDSELNGDNKRKGAPPPYNDSPRVSDHKPPNIYRAGMKDNLNIRVGEKVNSGQYDNVTNDW